MVDILSPTGNVLLTTTVSDESVRRRVLMGDNCLTLSFWTDALTDIPVGSYIIFEGEKLYLMSPQPPVLDGTYRYELTFEAVDGWLKRVMIFFMTPGGSTRDLIFSLTTDLRTFIDLVARCMNHELSGGAWETGDLDGEAGERAVTLSFQGETLFDALAMIAEAFSTEWYVTTRLVMAGDVMVEKHYINARRCEDSKTPQVEFKVDGIISTMEEQKGDDSEYGTRFYIFGGSKNLPEDYDSNYTATGLNNMYFEPRLRLPGRQEYIDARPDLSKGETVNRFVTFDDIYPKFVDTVTESHESASEGKWVAVLKNLPKSDISKAKNDELGCVFTSGALAGMDFKIEFFKNLGTGGGILWINILKKNIGTTENRLEIPNEDLCPKAGDKIVLTGILLGDKEVKEAEQELLKVGTEYAEKHCRNINLFSCDTNRVRCGEEGLSYDIGQKVMLVDPLRFGKEGRPSRIQEYEKNVNLPFIATYVVGDNSKYSRLGKIEKGISDTQVNERDVVYTGTMQNIVGKKYFLIEQQFERGLKAAYIKPTILHVPTMSDDKVLDDLYDLQIDSTAAVSGEAPEAGGFDAEPIPDATIDEICKL